MKRISSTWHLNIRQNESFEGDKEQRGISDLYDTKWSRDKTKVDAQPGFFKSQRSEGGDGDGSLDEDDSTSTASALKQGKEERKYIKRKTTPRQNVMKDINEVDIVTMRPSRLEEFMHAESRKQQIKAELQKHALSDEQMNLLMLDLVEPLSVVLQIYKNSNHELLTF